MNEHFAKMLNDINKILECQLKHAKISVDTSMIHKHWQTCFHCSHLVESYTAAVKIIWKGVYTQ